MYLTSAPLPHLKTVSSTQRMYLRIPRPRFPRNGTCVLGIRHTVLRTDEKDLPVKADGCEHEKVKLRKPKTMLR
jgi:hypothetical protein